MLLGALLYSSGGHGGGTAYIAAMGLVGVPPELLRPTALVMNVGVAGLGAFRFGRIRAIPWRLVGPLLAGSVPAAFVGGKIKLSFEAYTLLLGVLLLVAAWRLWRSAAFADPKEIPGVPVLVTIGAVLGVIAGLTCIGGGIFLSPILLLTGWADPRKTSGAAATFILINSISGLVAQAASLQTLPLTSFALAGIAFTGGLVGSWLGAHKLESPTLRRVHSVVVLVSGAKLAWEGVSKWAA